MNLAQTIFSLLASWALTASADQKADVPSCPDAVSVTVPAVAGWETRASSELHLNSATPISGPPDRHGDLASFTRKQKKDEWSETYDLNRPFPEGKWLECGYGTHNEVTLSKPLPAPVKTCTFNYRKGAKAGQRSIKVECR